MKRFRIKYLLILSVLGIFSVISVFVRLERPLELHQEYKVVNNHTSLVNVSPSVAPPVADHYKTTNTSTHRYKDDVFRGKNIHQVVAADNYNETTAHGYKDDVIRGEHIHQVVAADNYNETTSYRYKDDVIRGEHIHKAVARDVIRFRKQCYDKKWALEILHSSDGMFRAEERTCKKLPTAQHVSHLYGDDPVVYGMETCEQFRKNVQQVQREGNHERAVPTVRVAGLFNTGTNAMAVSLARNLQHDYLSWDEKVLQKFDRKREELFNVPWEKHVPPRFRDSETVVAQDQGIDFRLVLPVVLVRDPYWWMQSMCKQSYDLSWKKRGENRCPNIVNVGGINPVSAIYESKFPVHYDSLIHVWNEWNQEYFEADFPRLMIRFEDQLFHGEKVMQLISHCSGIPLRHPYIYQWRESKRHGQSSNLISALSNYGNMRGRQSPFDEKDLEYAKATLDPTLMQIFGYPHEVIPPRVRHAYRKKLGPAWGG